MRKLATLAITLLALLALAAPAVAQPENGDLGIFFDLGATSPRTTVPGFAIFNMYVCGYNLGPVSGWESKVTLSQTGWSVIGAALNPSNALNVGQVGNFIVGLGACVDAPGVHLLVSYQMGYFVGPLAPSDLLICTGGSTPSSFGGVPGYSSCGGSLIPFGAAQNGGSVYPNGCGVVNPTQEGPISAESVSFGAVKAGF
jgi:hypothetical protein